MGRGDTGGAQLMQADTILDVNQVAEHLRCEPGTAEDLMRDGKLPATKVGRGWITTYGQVIEFVIARIKEDRKKPEAITATIVQDEPQRRGRTPPPLPDLTR